MVIYMSIGIPRALFYYYDTELIINFLKELGINVIISSKTSKKTIEIGSMYASSEMCLSLKNYIGHVFELKDKVDYIFKLEDNSILSEKEYYNSKDYYFNQNINDL